MSTHEPPTIPTSSTAPSSSGPPPRRGRGGRLALAFVGLGLVALLAFGASRALGQGSRARGFGFGPHACSIEDAERHVTRMAGWLIDDVDGTPEQEAKLVEVAKAALKDLAPLRIDARENRRQIVAALTAPTIDRAALESLRARQVALMTTASTRLTTAIADAAEVLTPEQRVELAERLERHLH